MFIPKFTRQVQWTSSRWLLPTLGFQEMGSQGEDGDIGVGTFDKGGKWFGNSVSGSVAPVTMLEQVNEAKYDQLMALTRFYS